MKANSWKLELPTKSNSNLQRSESFQFRMEIGCCHLRRPTKINIWRSIMLALGIGLLSLYNADVPCSQVSFLPVCLSTYCFACQYVVHSIFQIIDIPKKTFPKLYELHTIDFSHNNITQIDRSVFVNLLSLRYLNFRHNHMEVIESSTFGKLTTLLSLDFSHNRLKRVKRGAFGGLASLRSINLGKLSPIESK